MGQRSDKATIENARKEMNLDKPLLVRYGLFLNDLSPIGWHSCDSASKEKYGYLTLLRAEDNALGLKFPYLGRSYYTKRNVGDVLAEALPGTIILALSAMLIATFFGILLGILAALKKDTWMDTSAIAASVAGISMPSFFAGLVIAYVFGYLLHNVTGLNMTGSLWEYDPFTGRHLAIRNLILPALALGIRPLAIITQLTRSSVLDVLSQDYIRTAYAKGLTPRRVIVRHALRGAMLPVVTYLGPATAGILTGSLVVERIFNVAGMGSHFIEAATQRDYTLAMGMVLVYTLLLSVMNLLVDLSYAIIDPRVKVE